jgi:hypothetical protein
MASTQAAHKANPRVQTANPGPGNFRYKSIRILHGWHPPRQDLPVQMVRNVYAPLVAPFVFSYFRGGRKIDCAQDHVGSCASFVSKRKRF